MKKQTTQPQESRLTAPMDIGTKEFSDFQALLLKKSGERTENQKKKIALLSIRFQMEDYIRSETNEMKSAGEFLKMAIQLLHVQQNKLANYIGMKPANLSKLISGERPINYDLALIFGKLFDLDPMFWIEIQAKNELKKLQQADKDKYADFSLHGLISEHKKAV